jgi:hypothetical protein
MHTDSDVHPIRKRVVVQCDVASSGASKVRCNRLEPASMVEPLRARLASLSALLETGLLVRHLGVRELCRMGQTCRRAHELCMGRGALDELIVDSADLLERIRAKKPRALHNVRSLVVVTYGRGLGAGAGSLACSVAFPRVKELFLVDTLGPWSDADTFTAAKRVVARAPTRNIRDDAKSLVPSFPPLTEHVVLFGPTMDRYTQTTPLSSSGLLTCLSGIDHQLRSLWIFGADPRAALRVCHYLPALRAVNLVGYDGCAHTPSLEFLYDLLRRLPGGIELVVCPVPPGHGTAETRRALTQCLADEGRGSTQVVVWDRATVSEYVEVRRMTAKFVSCCRSWWRLVDGALQ